MGEVHNPKGLSPKRRAYTTKTIVEHIRKGHRREQAFIRAGISRGTMYNWWRWYHEEVEDELEDTPLINFWNEVLEAEAEAEADIIDILRNSALNGNIKSAMYMLDKRYQWAAKQEVELSTKDDGAISIEIVDMTDDHLEEEGVSDGEIGDDQDSTEVFE